MKTDPTSLDLLHDLAEPAPVPWWPLAPGWYFVLAVLFGAAVWAAWRGWRGYRASAYRREAFKELQSARTPAEVSELLRRVALCVAPRTTVADLRGDRWADWLAASCPTAMPAEVRRSLVEGVYRPGGAGPETAPLREYAADWIRTHRRPEPSG
ncbi:hypothetical protein KOR34_07570 [Posidoniimonas corsicana]|uniref:DUF4381 domain-containing protein n=1 Tax=Posidoniimonas corsicana TaxID=1938618 RepID=A0A5C5VC80_9BACT|nr:DUF4381 domain-containing protein [Posidoniimonas corsicana]TWT35861.1 hypothetical protein KOR34_07570 [Posidoniimonas corsicana]